MRADESYWGQLEAEGRWMLNIIRLISSRSTLPLPWIRVAGQTVARGSSIGHDEKGE